MKDLRPPGWVRRMMHRLQKKPQRICLDSYSWISIAFVSVALLGACTGEIKVHMAGGTANPDEPAAVVVQSGFEQPDKTRRSQPKLGPKLAEGDTMRLKGSAQLPKGRGVKQVEVSLFDKVAQKFLGDGANLLLRASASSEDGAIWHLADGGDEWSLAFPIAWLSDGHAIELRVRVTDVTGKLYPPTTFYSFEWDVSPPFIKELSLSPIAADGWINREEMQKDAPLVEPPRDPDIASLSYALIDASEVCDGSLTFFPTMPTSQAPPLEDGVKAKVCARAADEVGNEVFVTSAAVAVDVEPPAIVLPSTKLAQTSRTTVASQVTGASRVMWTLESAPPDVQPLVWGNPRAPVTTVRAVDNGTYSLKLTAQDDAGNESTALMEVTWARTPLAFTALPLGGATADGYLNAAERGTSQAVVGTLNASGYESVGYRVASAAATCNQSLVYSMAAPLAHSAAFAVSDGSYKICVKLTDDAERSIYGESPTFILDTVAPTVSVGNDLLARQAVTPSVTVNGTGSLTHQWSRVAGPGTVIFGDSSQPSPSIAVDTDGSYIIRLTVGDEAGNVASDELTLTWDTTPPVIALPESLTASSSRYTLAPTVTGAVSYQWTQLAAPAGATHLQFASPGASSTEVTAWDDGVYRIQLKAQDALGNESTAAVDITWARTPLAFGALPLSGATADGYLNAAERTTTQAVVGSLNATGYESVGYGVASAAAACDQNTVYSTTAPSAQSSALAVSDGSYKICVTLTDDLGRSIYGESPAFILDTEVPQVDAGADVVALSAASATATVTGSGSLTYQWAKVSGPGEVTFGSVSNLTTTISANLDGVYTLRLTARDEAGNEGTDDLSFTWDAAPPVFTAATLAGPAADGYINELEKNQNLDLISVAGINGSGYSTVAYALTPWSTDCLASSLVFQTAIPQSSSSLFTNEGDYKICIALGDSQGRITKGASPKIILDVTAPSEVTVSNPEIATNVPVTLVGQATDASTYLWSKAAGPGDLIFATGNSTETLVTATADGTYNIIFEARDLAGNSESEVVVLNWDSTAPTFSSLALGTIVSDGYLNISEHATTGAITGSLTASGYSQVQYLVKEGHLPCSGGGSFSSQAPTTELSVFNTEGPKKVCVKLSDSFGNVTLGASSPFTVDLTAPVVSPMASILTRTSTGVSPQVSGALTYHWSQGIGAPGSITFGSPLSRDTTVTADADGTYTLTLTAADAAGNTTSGNLTFTWDTTPPTLAAIPLAHEALDGWINLAELVSTQPLLGTPQSSGYSSAGYRVVLASITCQASLSYGPPPLTNSLAIKEDGAYKVCVKVWDGAGNAAFGESPEIVLDKTPPSEVSAGPDLAMSGTLTLSGTGSGGSSFLWSQVSGPGTLTMTGETTLSPTITGTTEGVYTLRLTVRDAAGNEKSDSMDLTLDHTPPTFTSATLAPDIADGWMNLAEHGAFTPLVTAVVGSGYSTIHYKLVEDPSAAVDCSLEDGYGEEAPTHDLSLFLDAQNKTYKVCIKLLDQAGNVTFGGSPSFTADTTPPLVNVGPDIASGIPVSRAATVSEAGTYLWTKGSGEGQVTFSTATDLSTDVSADAGGIYTISLTATDLAGNIGQGSFQLTWVTAGPEFQSLPLTGVSADGYINGSEATSSGPLTGALVASQYSSATYALVPFASTCSGGSGYEPSAPDVADLTGDGAFKVCVRLINDSGLTTYGASPKVVRDTEAPQVVAGSDLTVRGPTRLQGAATAATTWQWSQVGGAGTLTISSPTTLNPQVTAPADGEYTLRLSATDAAGNSATDDLTLTWDTAPPGFGSLPLAGDAVGGYVNGTEHGQTTPLAGPLSASGYTEAQYKLVLEGAPCDSLLLTYGAMPASNDSALNTPGRYLVCVRLTDTAGNVTYGQSPAFVFDTQGPTVQVDNTGLINAAQAGAYQVVGSCSEDQQPVVIASGAVSQSGICSQNEFSIVLDLTGILDGPVTITATHSDLAGNVATGTVSDLVLDTTAPLVDAGSALFVSGPVTHTGAATGAASLLWSKDSGPGNVTFGSSTSLETTIDVDTDGVYVLRLTATDAAGNSAFSTLTLTRNSVPTALAVQGPLTFTAGTCEGPISMTQRSSDQIPVAASAPVLIELNDGGAGAFYSDPSCSQATTFVILPAFASTAQTYYRSQVAGTYTITASAAGLAPSSTSLTVQAGTPARWVFTAIPELVALGACSTVVTVGTQDAWGNSALLLSETELTIAGLGSAAVYADPGCETAAGSLTVPSGASTRSFYLKGTVAETLPLSVSGGGMTSGSGTMVVYAGPATALSFALPDQPKVLDCMPLRIVGRDANGAQAPLGSTVTATVTSSHTSLKFYSNAQCTSAATSIVLGGGTLGSTLYLMGTTAGSYTLTSQGTGLTQASSTVTLQGLMLTWSPSSSSVSADACSGALTLGLHLSSGPATTINRTFTVTFSGIGAGAFYSDSGCSQAISSFAWAPNQGTQTLFYKNYRRESLSLRASASSITTGVLAMEVLALPAVALRIAGPGAIHTDQCYDSFTVLSMDGSSNPSSVSVDTDITWTGIGQGSFYSDAACATPVTSVRLAAGTSVQRLYFKSHEPDELMIVPVASGMTGQSLSLTVDLAPTRSVVVGVHHVCHVTHPTGAVRCWGRNYYGQLGDGTRTDRWTPISVNVGGTAIQLTSGDRHTCALLADGTIKCWGENNVGQVGKGTASSSYQLTPVTVLLPAGSVAKDMASGWGHTCALMMDGSVWCWGDNRYGQLGVGDTTLRATPVAVNLGAGRWAKKVVAGNSQTCVLMEDDSLRCWGYDVDGRIGYGDKVNKLLPPSMALELGRGRWVKDLSVGANHACAVMDDDTLRCWGLNSAGQLGVGDTVQRLVPPSAGIDFGAHRKVKRAYAGRFYTCAVLDNNQATCWGSNEYGKLGVPYYGRALRPLDTPIAFPDSLAVRTLAVGNTGGETTCAILADDRTTCWGHNLFSNLGLNNISGRSAPAVVPVDLGTGSVTPQVAAGRAHTCVLSRDGKVRCYGNNTNGECGYSLLEQGFISRSEGIHLGAPATAIAVGADHSCAILAGGTISCWGLNSSGQLGNNTNITNGIPSPVIMPAGKVAQSLSLGMAQTCAVMTDGSAYCWGAGRYGALGNGSTGNKWTPTKVPFPGDATVKKISVGNYHACAILGNDTAACWGFNNYGQLGLGDTTDRTTPGSALNGGAPVLSISAGLRATCVAFTDQTTRCYGSNAYVNELGLATSGGLLNVGTGRHAVHITGSMGTQCALLDDQSLKCWGAGSYYQLGTGSRSNAAPTSAINFGTHEDGTPLRVLSASTGSHTCAILDNNTVQCLGRNDLGQHGDLYLTYWEPPSGIASLSP